MPVKKKDAWTQQVRSVFNVAPRIGVSGTMWVQRSDAERELADAFDRPANHVCIDGPSGTGKSSLALTFLEKREIPYCSVQLTKNTDWPRLCRELASPSQANQERSVQVDVEAGIDKGLPQGKFRMSLGRKGRPSDNLDLLDKQSTAWGEHDVARLMADEGLTVIVDDFERASPEMVARVADLCRILIQAHSGSEAKLLIIGTRDTYKRLFDEVQALEHRISGLSLGPFEVESQSWSFLAEGFERLKLRHPGNSSFASQADKLATCQQAVFEAADGLPKSLNELGRRLATKARGKTAVSAFDIVTEAHRMADANWSNHWSHFHRVLNALEQSEVAVNVVRVLYERGVCRIHDILHIGERLREQFSPEDVDAAIDLLVGAQFLIRTGATGEIVYVNNPTAAHTFGVVISSPERFKGAPELIEKAKLVSRAFPRRQFSTVPPEDAGEASS